MVDLKSFDLNLLVALDALIIEGSVSGAARRIGIGQPAISHALGRLRDLFGDPLLVLARRGTGLARSVASCCPRDNNALLSIGVPADWLADVRAASEDGFVALTAHLPAEAAEALLEYAATGRLLAAAPAPAVADPFAHPDALRRIRLIADQDELEQALAFPWEQWGVFLDPSQRALVERSFAGPARVANVPARA